MQVPNSEQLHTIHSTPPGQAFLCDVQSARLQDLEAKQLQVFLQHCYAMPGTDIPANVIMLHNPNHL